MVDENEAGERLDKWLAAQIPDLSRRRVRVLLDIGGVWLGDSRVKNASRETRAGQTYTVFVGGALDRAVNKVGKAARAQDASVLPDFSVVYEDADIVVVDKPAGLLTAPTPESDGQNLLHFLKPDSETPMGIAGVLDGPAQNDLHRGGYSWFTGWTYKPVVCWCSRKVDVRTRCCLRLFVNTTSTGFIPRWLPGRSWPWPMGKTSRRLRFGLEKGIEALEAGAFDIDSLVANKPAMTRVRIRSEEGGLGEAAMPA